MGSALCTGIRMRYAAMAGLVAGVVLLLGGAFQMLFNKWFTDDYSYCFLVPVLALYLGYRKRKLIVQSGSDKVTAGYFGLALAAVLYLAGGLGSLETLVYISLWVFICSIVILCMGSPAAKHLKFPLFVLFFAIPAPPLITNLLTWQLRLISSARR